MIAMMMANPPHDELICASVSITPHTIRIHRSKGLFKLLLRFWLFLPNAVLTVRTWISRPAN
jgi:hypothetical protein